MRNGERSSAEDMRVWRDLFWCLISDAVTFNIGGGRIRECIAKRKGEHLVRI